MVWPSCDPRRSAGPGLNHTHLALKTPQDSLSPWKTLQELVLGVVMVTLPWDLQGALTDDFLGLGHWCLQARTQIPLKTLKKLTEPAKNNPKLNHFIDINTNTIMLEEEFPRPSFVPSAEKSI